MRWQLPEPAVSCGTTHSWGASLGEPPSPILNSLSLPEPLGVIPQKEQQKVLEGTWQWCQSTEQRGERLFHVFAFPHGYMHAGRGDWGGGCQKKACFFGGLSWHLGELSYLDRPTTVRRHFVQPSKPGPLPLEQLIPSLCHPYCWEPVHWYPAQCIDT